MTNFLILLSCMCLVLGASAGRAHHSRGCIFCSMECPTGTHVYSSPCSMEIPTWSERTCKSPTPHNIGPICDLIRCDCNEPTVKDKTTGKCVKIENCPQPDSVIDIRTNFNQQ